MRRTHRYGIAMIVGLAAIVLFAGPASAHTGFESSDPADGASVAGPVSTITLVFTGEAEPTGDGFQALDPNGQVREPNEAVTEDGLTWVLRFDPPIADGVAGVRWMVKAPDAHPIDGSFSFSVTASVPVQVAPESALAPGSLEVESASTPESSVSESAPVAQDEDPAGERRADLEAFLDTDGDPAGVPRSIGAVGRILTVFGTLVGVGALIFAAVVLRGDHRDVRHVLFWVRRAGALVAAGALIEVVAQMAVEAGGQWSTAVLPSTMASVVFSSFGIAATLRIVGGSALSSGARFEIADASQARDPVVTIKELVGAGAGPPVDLWGVDGAGFDSGQSRGSSEPYIHDGDHAWLPTADSAGAYIGVVALLAAYLFDGHTVSKGDRLFTALVDLVHVTGGAIWAGGLLMLVDVLWRRHRQGRETRALQLAIRFSVVASMALVAVGAAGLVLTAIVLDSPSELWSTDWGRLLMAKTFFVALAGIAGGYNHRVLVPQLSGASDNPALTDRFRTVVSLEALALVAVVVLTALLVGAAS